VFTGKDASFTLYEDEGENYNYENDKYATFPFTYKEATKTLTIGDRSGSFTGMKESRSLHIVWISKDHATGVSLDAASSQTISYSGKQITLTMK
jgi:alpha-D-xyloside xylohydrolase